MARVIMLELALLIVAGFVLQLWLADRRPDTEHEIEQQLWRELGFRGRRRVRADLAALPSTSVSPELVALRDLESTSSRAPATIVAIEASRSGTRDRCRVGLADGRSLWLTAFDRAQIAAFTRNWQRHPERGARLRWIEGVGWWCGLVDPSDRMAVGQLWAWEARIQPTGS